jgi:hypothetical protein
VVAELNYALDPEKGNASMKDLIAITHLASCCCQANRHIEEDAACIVGKRVAPI